MTKGNKRAFVIAAVLFVCLALIGSALFVLCSADHDCTHGDDCEVCRMIDMCIHTVCALSVFIAAAAAVLLAPSDAKRTELPAAPAYRAATLIALKTELRN